MSNIIGIGLAGLLGYYMFKANETEKEFADYKNLVAKLRYVDKKEIIHNQVLNKMYGYSLNTKNHTCRKRTRGIYYPKNVFNNKSNWF